VLNPLDFRKAETYYGEYSDEYSAQYFQAYKGRSKIRRSRLGGDDTLAGDEPSGER
jgi:hypothetical protein